MTYPSHLHLKCGLCLTSYRPCKFVLFSGFIKYSIYYFTWLLSFSVLRFNHVFVYSRHLVCCYCQVEFCYMAMSFYLWIDNMFNLGHYRYCPECLYMTCLVCRGFIHFCWLDPHSWDLRVTGCACGSVSDAYGFLKSYWIIRLPLTAYQGSNCSPSLLVVGLISIFSLF